MPWCDSCDRFYNPNSLPTSAECPGCGQVLMRPAQLRKVKQGKGGGPDALAAMGASGQRALDEGRADPGDRAPAHGGEDDDDHTPVPWHFWILIVALVIYLGWRLVQLIIWLGR